MKQVAARLSRIFLAGLAVLLPVVITVGFIWWLLAFFEGMFAAMIRPVLGDLYTPGMGWLLGIGLVMVAGLAVQTFVFRRLFRWAEEQLKRIPLVQTVYGAVRDLMSFFGGDKRKQFNKVVRVKLPGTEFHLIGFVTREDFIGLPEHIAEPGHIAVYLPMSYQIGGYTVLLPRDSVVPIDMSFEEGMRFVVTAGLSVTPEKTDLPDDATIPLPR
jgi:uncharacterized membrane protein